MCLALDGHPLWLAWLPDPQQAKFVGGTEGVLAADSRSQLMAAVRRRLPGSSELPPCHLDIDAACADAERGIVRDADGALDLWHLFTDFAATAGGTAIPLFMEEHMPTYHKVFSLCDAAANAGLPSAALGAEDIAHFAAVMRNGRDMLRHQTVSIWDARPAAAIS